MKKTIKSLLRRAGYYVEDTRYTPRHLYQPECVRALQFDDVVCRYMFDHGQNCNFIQIGAFDGLAADPLRRYVERCGWRGVMLEPQPGPATELRRLYSGNTGIIIIEAAVADERTTRTLYVVESETLPKWARGMASFDRAHILKHDYLLPGIEKFVHERFVNCVTFDDILESQHGGAKLDLLQIDAEGSDGHVLSLFPFHRLKPPIVHWEIKNMMTADQEAALDLLCSHGYKVARSGGEDMLAVRGDNV